MSTEAVGKFLDEIAQNKQLGDEIRNMIAEREEQAAFELVDFAGKRGYEFTATELRQHLAGMQKKTVELSDVELESVAGGLLTNLGRISILRAARRKKKSGPDS